MKKHLEAPSRSSNFVQPKENKAEFRSCHSGKESLFCALMYEDTCQKKKRKQISSMRKEHGRQPRQGEKKSEEETNLLLEA